MLKVSKNLKRKLIHLYPLLTVPRETLSEFVNMFSVRGLLDIRHLKGFPHGKPI